MKDCRIGDMKDVRTLSVSAVVDRTGLPLSTVYHLIARGDFATVRIGDRGRYRVLVSSIEGFFEKNTRGGEVKPLREISRAARRQAAAEAVLPDGDLAFS